MMVYILVNNLHIHTGSECGYASQKGQCVNIYYVRNSPEGAAIWLILAYGLYVLLKSMCS